MTGGSQGDHSQRPRIAQVIEATTGGTRKHLWLLLTRLRFDGNLSLIYSNKRDPHFAKDLEEYRKRGIELIEVPMSREIDPVQDIISFCRLTHLFRNRRFDLVHAHSSKAGFLARMAAACAGVRSVVYAPHCFAFQYISQRLMAGFYRSLEQLAARTGNHLLCVSESEARLAMENGIASAERLHVIPNTIATDEIHLTRTAEEVRRSLAIDPAALVVGTVAQFRPQKNLERLLRAVPSVLERVPSAVFLFVGDGLLMSNMQAMARSLRIEEHVRFAGHQENTWNYYQIMNAFVLSSVWEGMPYVLLEAMAMGLPVVASDVPGNNEVIVHGRNGYVCPSENSAGFSDAIVRLLLDRNLRERMGEEGQRMLKKRLSIDEWQFAYASFYRRILEGDAEALDLSPKALSLSSWPGENDDKTVEPQRTQRTQRTQRNSEKRMFFSASPTQRRKAAEKKQF